MLHTKLASHQEFRLAPVNNGAGRIYPRATPGYPSVSVVRPTPGACVWITGSERGSYRVREGVVESELKGGMEREQGRRRVSGVFLVLDLHFCLFERFFQSWTFHDELAQDIRN